MKNFGKWLTVILSTVVLAACSDGEMSQPTALPDIGKPLPAVIKSFLVADAKDAKAAGDKIATIDSGGGVFLIWEVENASKIEIKDSKGDSAAGEGLKLKDRAEVKTLANDESFVLTAYGNDGKTKQATVTVVIRKKDVKILSFTATPEKIRAGEMSRLCWELSDKEAKVSVMDGETEVYPGNSMPEVATTTEPEVTPASEESMVTKAMRFLLKGAETPSAPTVTDNTEEDKTEETGAPAFDVAKETCTDVSPGETTKYTLNVKDGDKLLATQDKTVEVIAAPAQIEIVFDAQPTQASGPREITLTWRVKPDDVTVDVDHDVTKGDKAQGEKKVKVKETTTFTLTATTPDGQSKTQSVTVTVGRSGGMLTAQAISPSVFAGESAKVRIAEGDVTGTLSVLDPSGAKSDAKLENGLITIANPLSGSYTVDADGARSNPVAVEVRSFQKRNGEAYGLLALGLGKVVSGSSAGVEGIDEKEKPTLGVMLSDVVEDSLVTNHTVNINAELAKRINSELNVGQLKQFAPFAVRAIAADQRDAKRIFFGTTGALLMSTDGGSSWKLVDPLPIFDNAKKFSSPEQHKGCDGSTQAGVSYQEANGALVGMIQICDIVADGKKVTLATDQGTYYVDDVDARLDAAKRKTTPWNVGISGKVVNRLAVAKSGSNSVLVAATSDGVYISSGNGDAKSWQQLDKGGLSGSVNAVAVSGSTIYAGTDKGLYTCSGLDGNGKCSALSGYAGAVKAVEVDAADGSILYVGSDKGLQVSRDCAGGFTFIWGVSGAVRNIATAAEGSQSVLAVATDGGLYTSKGVAGKGSGTCVAPKDQRPESKPVQQTDPEKVPPPSGPASPTPPVRPS